MNRKELEAQDDMIQNMSVKELKTLFSKGKSRTVDTNALYSEEQQSVFQEEIECSEEELSLHNMSPIELNNLYKRSKKLLPIAEKTAKTGLSKKVIERLEKNKRKATLEEIIAYCQGLKISFREFLPELFGKPDSI